MNLSPHAIAKALGGEARGNHVSAPGPGHSPRDRSLSILVDWQAPDGFIVSSFASDDPLDCRDYVRQRLGLPEWQPQRQAVVSKFRHQKNDRADIAKKNGADQQICGSGIPVSTVSGSKAAVARSIWRKAVPIIGTHAEGYLRARGISLPDNPSLRFLAVAECGGAKFPALIAAMMSSAREICAVQVTFLDHSAPQKADIPVQRKTFGGMTDGAVRLGRAAAVLGIAEGVETGLAAMQLSGVPVWCCLGATRMHQVFIPDTIRELHIFADDDDAGRKAADRTAAHHKSRRVLVRLPPTGCKDWNDALRARCAA